jgi:hypothetical protein
MRHGWFAAGLLVLAGAAGAMAQSASQEKEGIVGKDAPDLLTREWINSDGRTSIADFKGEVVLVENWKTG